MRLSTQYLLNRGQRLTEILKQPQFTPMPIELQVIILFGATRGHLDGMAVDKIAKFEASLIQHVEPQLLEEIRKEGQITPELETKLSNFLGGLTSA